MTTEKLASGSRKQRLESGWRKNSREGDGVLGVLEVNRSPSVRGLLCHGSCHTPWWASHMQSSLKIRGGHITSRGPVCIHEYAEVGCILLKF